VNLVHFRFLIGGCTSFFAGGKGILTFGENGGRYEGDWLNGKRHGFVRLHFQFFLLFFSLRIFYFTLQSILKFIFLDLLLEGQNDLSKW
jgi:hypothetical protein